MTGPSMRTCQGAVEGGGVYRDEDATRQAALEATQGGNGSFFKSTQIQMLPRRVRICGRLTSDLPLGCLQGGGGGGGYSPGPSRSPEASGPCLAAHRRRGKRCRRKGGAPRDARRWSPHRRRCGRACVRAPEPGENLLITDQHDHRLSPPAGVVVLLGSRFLAHTTRS